MTKSAGVLKGEHVAPLTTPQQAVTGTTVDSTQRISPKLTTRLKSLIPTSSKETLQTHSKWILFHSNRHERSICESLLQILLQSCRFQSIVVNNVEQRRQQQEENKGVVYLTIIHEMFIMYKNKPNQWNRHSKFRLRLGDSVLLPFLERVVADSSDGISAAMLDSFETMTAVWKKLDCFGGNGDDILINEILRLVSRIDTAPVNNNSDAFEKDAARGVIDSMDVDIPERTLDNSNTTTISSSTNKNSASMQTSSPPSIIPLRLSAKEKKLATATVQQEEAVRKNVTSNSEETSMHAPLTPTASDDDMFGLPDEDDDRGLGDKDEGGEGEMSPNKLSSETFNKLEKAADIKTISTQEKEFDFESEGVPQQKVEINQLQTPCKSIATVQITRDLHSDTAHSVSSLLSTVPDPVLKACRDAMGLPPSEGNDSSNDNGKVAASIDLKALPLIPDPVLDLNLKQILSNVRSHRDIIQKQKVARETLVRLLVQSRCQFGSKDTAKMYYGLREMIDRLQSCKSKVLDAMELEGLDREGIDDDRKAGDIKDDTDGDVLKDFEWFSREQADEEKSSKRVRLG